MQTIPTHLVITDLLKAHPAEEGGRRYVYVEASNEAIDHQGEVVLAKALEESAPYFLRYGNLDLDHMTQLGPKAGISDYPLYEIGRPVDVKVSSGCTFVKGEIFQGDSPVAHNANMFWDSLTKVRPPQRWYPSVGGAVIAPKEQAVDTRTGIRKSLVTKVRWTNIGFSKTPVNLDVPTAATIPIGVFAKSWGVNGLDLEKALEAGYGTDSASLTGGSALRKQSLYGTPINYWDFRHRLSDAVLKKAVNDPGAEELVSFATSQMGLNQAQAAEWVERFLHDLKTGLRNRRTK